MHGDTPVFFFINAGQMLNTPNAMVPKEVESVLNSCFFGVMFDLFGVGRDPGQHPQNVWNILKVLLGVRKPTLGCV